MTAALLDHVRLSDSMQATLDRVRRHLAEAIAEAEADGDLPSDSETVERIGELVEAISQLALRSVFEDEHFAFGDFGTFAVTMWRGPRVVYLEQHRGGRAEAVSTLEHSEESIVIPMGSTSCVLEAVEGELVR